MLRLLLIRHGETHWNAAARFQGQRDVPLNPRGRQQVAAVARALSRVPLDALYASDLRRTWETAQALSGVAGLATRPEPRLREMSFGAWEG